MSLKNYIYSFLLIAFCASCEDATKNSLQEIRYTVASKKVDCVGIGPQKCFLIKKNEEKNWQYFYSSFNDFNYEEGFEYEILVSEKEIENLPQDASSIEYALLKVISKTKKTSENLPK